MLFYIYTLNYMESKRVSLCRVFNVSSPHSLVGLTDVFY